MVAAHRGAGSQSLTDKLPVVEGAVAGAVGYITGLIFTFLLLTIDGDVDLDAAAQGGAGTLDVVGWFFYSAHFANIEASGSTPIGSGSTTGNFVSESSTQIPAVIYYLVPAVILIGVGFFVVATLDMWNPSPADCAQAGATVVLGYLPLALIGIFLFEASVSFPGGEVSQGPELLTSILLAGLLFPLLFGAIGGFLFSQSE